MNLAYVAGIIDGEGCIQFTRTRTTIFPRVLVVNTDLGLLKALKAQFGGDIRPLCRRRAGWKQGYQWRISWARAVKLISRIEPWLRVKNQQAHTVFAWAAVSGGRGVRTDPEVRDFLKRRMTWLNAKGPVQGPDPVDEEIALSAAHKSKRGK